MATRIVKLKHIGFYWIVLRKGDQDEYLVTSYRDDISNEGFLEEEYAQTLQRAQRKFCTMVQEYGERMEKLFPSGRPRKQPTIKMTVTMQDKEPECAN